MNSEVSIIEPETLEYLPAKTLLRLVEQSQKTAKNAKVFRLTVGTFPELFRTFEELDLNLAFNLDNEYMNLSFAGDGEKLKTVWGHMRRAGFNTTNRPAKGDTTFNAFWHQEGFAEIFMMFSSYESLPEAEDRVNLIAGAGATLQTRVVKMPIGRCNPQEIF